ncbi:MAG: peptidoglycan-binding protein [Rhodanobacter sp.]
MSDRVFSGGDSLVPGSMEHRTYEIMMKSELRNGKGAYEMGNAGAAASGPSFGPFQYDIGANQDGRNLLESIAANATDAQSHRIISDQELESIKSHLYKPFNTFTDADRTVYAQMKPKLDSALSSDAGVHAINADFVPGVQKKVAVMDAVVNGMTTEPNKTFVQNSDVAKLILIDTKNQYGKAVNDGLKEFIDRTKDDPAMDMPGRAHGTTIKVDGEFGLDDMIRYKLETQYGQNDQGAKDVLRRISHCVEAAGVDNVKASLSEEDRTFLETGLEKYLKDRGRDTKILDDPQLKALAELGGREQHQTRSHASHAHSTSLELLKVGSVGHDVTALQRNLSGLGYTDAQEHTLVANGHFDTSTKESVENFQRGTGLASIDGKAGSKTLEQVKAQVTEVQENLATLGYKQNSHTLTVDGDFGQATRAAVEAFQKDRALPQTGVVDAPTHEQLTATLKQHAQPTTALRLDQVDHPDHAFFREAQAHIYRMDQQLGRVPDNRSDNLSSALSVQARADGLQRIDLVALSEDGNRLWAVERPAGRQDALFDRRTSVPTTSVNVPIEQSSMQWPRAMEQFQQSQTPRESQTQAPQLSPMRQQ